MATTQPDGYLALPSGGTGYPVMVLHAWWGLNDTIKGVCDRLAGSGFVAYAPDLYRGKVTSQIDEAEALGAALDENVSLARADLAAATAFLAAKAGLSDQGIAVLGFSLGAFYALDLSMNAPETIRSVVLFYGTGPADFGQAKAAYLGHFAAQDAFEPQSNVAELKSALQKAGRPVTFHTYPSTGHWFFEPDRVDAYNPAAASLAWERTLAFLTERHT